MVSERDKYIKEHHLKENYTTIFLMPMYNYFWNFFPKEFIGAYIRDETKPKIALCFNNTDSILLKDAVIELQNNNHFHSIGYDDNNKEVVVFMNIPKEYIVDFNLFKIGRWSKFSNNLKEVLLDYHGRETGMGKRIMMVDALFPSKESLEWQAKRLGVSVKDLPNEEVMSIPDLSREEYRVVEEFIKYEEKIKEK